MYNKLLTKSNALAIILAAMATVVVNPACAKESTDKKSAARQTEGAVSPPQTAEKPHDTAQTARAADSSSDEKKSDVTVDVYLFHGTYRCYSCNRMEELTVQAIGEQLAREKNSGTVKFSHINVEEDQNRHFIEDYRLSAISIILSRKSGGKEEKWKNLDQVWMLLRDDVKFKEYILSEIRNLLKG